MRISIAACMMLMLTACVSKYAQPDSSAPHFNMALERVNWIIYGDKIDEYKEVALFIGEDRLLKHYSSPQPSIARVSYNDRDRRFGVVITSSTMLPTQTIYVSCEVIFTFLPEAGKMYAVKPFLEVDSSGASCRADVIDMDTGARAPRLRYLRPRR